MASLTGQRAASGSLDRMQVAQSPRHALTLLASTGGYIIRNLRFDTYTIRSFELNALARYGIPVAESFVRWLLNCDLIAPIEDPERPGRLLYLMTAEGRRQGSRGLDHGDDAGEVVDAISDAIGRARNAGSRRLE